jgi:transcriptional antiterminator NusG
MLDPRFDLWAPLRCHSSQTLDLADRLASEGLDGWAPRIRVHRRLPRRRKAELRILPLLPSFVFVPNDRLEPALELAERGRVPRHWPFTFNGERRLVPLEQLQILETIAPLRAHNSAHQSFHPGDQIRVIYGPLCGHRGSIVSSKGRDRWLVDLAGLGMRAWVPSFLLQAD